MGDETVKIFLNTAGTMDDISEELKAFLDYVAGKKSNDSFVCGKAGRSSEGSKEKQGMEA